MLILKGKDNRASFAKITLAQNNLSVMLAML